MEKQKITIPQEILKCSKLNINLPLYLYLDKDYTFFLSNKKNYHICYGIIHLDKEYSFKIPQSILNYIPYSSPIFEVYTINSIIYIRKVYNNNFLRAFNPLINPAIIIPDEILELSYINFKKTLYLYRDRADVLSLSNQSSTSSKYRHKECFGAIKLFPEAYFFASQNLCNAFKIEKIDNLIFYFENNEVKIKNLAKK